MTSTMICIAATLLATSLASPVFAQSNRQTNTPGQTTGGMENAASHEPVRADA